MAHIVRHNDDMELSNTSLVEGAFVDPDLNIGVQSAQIDHRRLVARNALRSMSFGQIKVRLQIANGRQLRVVKCDLRWTQ